MHINIIKPEVRVFVGKCYTHFEIPAYKEQNQLKKKNEIVSKCRH